MHVAVCQVGIGGDPTEVWQSNLVKYRLLCGIEGSADKGCLWSFVFLPIVLIISVLRFFNDGPLKTQNVHIEIRQEKKKIAIFPPCQRVPSHFGNAQAKPPPGMDVGPAPVTRCMHPVGESRLHRYALTGIYSPLDPVTPHKSIPICALISLYLLSGRSGMRCSVHIMNLARNQSGGND